MDESLVGWRIVEYLATPPSSPKRDIRIGTYFFLLRTGRLISIFFDSPNQQATEFQFSATQLQQ